MKKKLISFLLIIPLLCLPVGCQSEAGSSSEVAAVTSAQDTDDATFAIETDYCVLKYPKNFEADVVIDKSENAVAFSCEEQKLFDVTFNDENAVSVGTLSDGTIVGINSYDIDSDNANYDNLCAMQEGINIIIENLTKDYNLK